MSWFTGGGAYHNLMHCMAGDMFWVWARVAVSALISAGYVLFVVVWLRSARDSEGRSVQTLTGLAWIFFWCGVSGYLTTALSVYWPAYRIQVIASSILFMWVALWLYREWRELSLVVRREPEQRNNPPRQGGTDVMDDEGLRAVMSELQARAERLS